MNLAILYSPWFTSMAPWLLAVFSCQPARMLPAAPPPQAARHVPPLASCRLLLPGAWASLRSSLSAAQEGRQATHRSAPPRGGAPYSQAASHWPLRATAYGGAASGQRYGCSQGDGLQIGDDDTGRCLVQLL